jgi:hypothetical protein
MACPATVHDTVCIGADVTITPDVQVDGEIESFCVGGPVIGVCPGTPEPTCSFTVSQRICVQVPLVFSATATADPAGVVCETADTGECPLTTACTRTIGYYKNHPTETNALIEAAGGSIILGSDEDGLSFTVTTENADEVLDFNTPSPPAPESPPLSGQYQNLYAQLLAANLNVLSEAGCDYATDAIEAANEFLATSPPGGTAGAGTYGGPLDTYNKGLAPGCPGHCPEE